MAIVYIFHVNAHIHVHGILFNKYISNFQVIVPKGAKKKVDTSSWTAFNTLACWR